MLTRREWYKLKKKFCERCGSKRTLHLHHKDHNHKNNTKRNALTLCCSCHNKEHQRHRNLPRLTSKRRKEISRFMKTRWAAGLVNVNTKVQRAKASARMKLLNKVAQRDRLGRIVLTVV